MGRIGGSPELAALEYITKRARLQRTTSVVRSAVRSRYIWWINKRHYQTYQRRIQVNPITLRISHRPHAKTCLRMDVWCVVMQLTRNFTSQWEWYIRAWGNMPTRERQLGRGGYHASGRLGFIGFTGFYSFFIVDAWERKGWDHANLQKEMEVENQRRGGRWKQTKG